MSVSFTLCLRVCLIDFLITSLELKNLSVSTFCVDGEIQIGLERSILLFIALHELFLFLNGQNFVI